MPDTPSVSIIVPVYNAAATLPRAVESLLSQTLADIEVLLIDDGSTDASPRLCDAFARRDGRVRVIHRANGGVSRARQTGLEAARGEYVIHADPDDWAEPGMARALLGAARRTGADMVTCDFFQDGSPAGPRYADSAGLLRGLVGVTMVCSCWNVLVRRGFITGHAVGFTPPWLEMSEDFLFLIRLLAAGARAAHLPQAFYHYCSTTPRSLTNSRSRRKLRSIRAVISEIEALVPAADYDSLYMRRKLAVMYAFQGRMLSLVPALYPEIHARLASDPEPLARLLWSAVRAPRLTYAAWRWQAARARLRRMLSHLFHR